MSEVVNKSGALRTHMLDSFSTLVPPASASSLSIITRTPRTDRGARTRAEGRYSTNASAAEANAAESPQFKPAPHHTRVRSHLYRMDQPSAAHSRQNSYGSPIREETGYGCSAMVLKHTGQSSVRSTSMTP